MPSALATRGIVTAVVGLVLSGCSASPSGPPPIVGSFGDFTPGTGRAHYLACPQNYCFATPDELTALKTVPAADLRDLVRQTLDAQPRTELLSSAKEGLRLVYRQQGGLFSASGTVTVEIADADIGLSGIVLYGEADKAGDDLGASRQRVHDWLAAIDAAVAHAAHS